MEVFINDTLFDRVELKGGVLPGLQDYVHVPPSMKLDFKTKRERFNFVLELLQPRSPLTPTEQNQAAWNYVHRHYIEGLRESQDRGYTVRIYIDGRDVTPYIFQNECPSCSWSIFYYEYEYYEYEYYDNREKPLTSKEQNKKAI